MTLFTLFRRRPATAPVARERLQILLAHERALASQPDLVGVLLDEILTVIGRHFTIERDQVHVKLDRGSNVSTLEIGIEMPSHAMA
jgi:cell division topological specificity factor